MNATGVGPKKSRVGVCVGRWFDILVMSLIGVVAWSLLRNCVSAFFLVTMKHAFLTWGESPDSLLWSMSFLEMPVCVWAFGVAYVLLSAVLAWFLIRAGGLAIGHFRTIAYYPPTWVAAIPTVLVEVSLLRDARFPIWHCLVGIGLLVLGVAIAILASRDWRRHTTFRMPVNVPSRQDAIRQLTKSPSELLRWLEEDLPVADPSQDLFGAFQVATRISRSLRSLHAPTICLEGAWGSGKTTAMKLLEGVLEAKEPGSGIPEKGAAPGANKAILCWIDSWGLAGESIVRVLLREAVKRLRRHIDTIALSALPNQYIQALKGASPNWLQSLLEFLGKQASIDTIQHLNGVLKAIDTRLVLVIEDLDRNFGSTGVSLRIGGSTERAVRGRVTPAEGRKQFSELVGLLDAIGKMDQITYIITYTELSS